MAPTHSGSKKKARTKNLRDPYRILTSFDDAEKFHSDFAHQKVLLSWSISYLDFAFMLKALLHAVGLHPFLSISSPLVPNFLWVFYLTLPTFLKMVLYWLNPHSEDDLLP